MNSGRIKNYSYGLQLLQVFCLMRLADIFFLKYAVEAMPSVFEKFHIFTILLGGIGSVFIMLARSRSLGLIHLVLAMTAFWFTPLVGWLFLSAYFRGEPVEKGVDRLGKAFTWSQITTLVGMGAYPVFFYLDTLYREEQIFEKFQNIPLVMITITASFFCAMGLQERRNALASGERPWRNTGDSEPFGTV